MDRGLAVYDDGRVIPCGIGQARIEFDPHVAEFIRIGHHPGAVRHLVVGLGANDQHHRESEAADRNRLRLPVAADQRQGGRGQRDERYPPVHAAMAAQCG